ncbi:MAG: PASTA domain-containing protein [Muribaculaceae bacterium]|nr:PASTA domain-containing protein [Muribaculaceae bacterium]
MIVFEKIKLFFKNHRIIANVILILIVAWVLCTFAMYFLDVWTHHGDQVQVPSVKGMSYTEATNRLFAEDFTVEITDSIFDSSMRPGTVVEQSPNPGANVKPGRTVYLTVVAFTPKMVTVPYYLNASLRQGRSMFEGLGFKRVDVRMVPSEYKDLVLGAHYNGLPLTPGMRIPITAKITLEVGLGYGAGGDEDEEGGESENTETETVTE